MFNLINLLRAFKNNWLVFYVVLFIMGMIFYVSYETKVVIKQSNKTLEMGEKIQLF